MIDIRALADEALGRIRNYVRMTAVEHSPVLSDLAGVNVYLKLENLQITGSFKARGAFNRMLALPEEERRRGVVAASTGNHGAAVAYAAKALGISSIIFVPEGAQRVKVENIRRFGGDVRTQGLEAGASEIYARAYANDHRLCYVSPYNDPLVVAGQGTIGSEIEQILPDVGAVVASVGGGGLIAGVSGYLKGRRPNVLAIGVSPHNSMAMLASVRAGRIVETEHLPTLSDGTSGGLEPGAITFELCRSLVDEFIEVSEDEIRAALKLFIESHHMLCEGAAATAIAGVLKAKSRVQGRTAVVVISGANISADRLKSAL